jgi:carbamoyl-phosphate synthase large subunit
MNVLLTSAGAKVALLRAWREAATARAGRLIATDCAGDAAALFEADQAYLLPHCAEADWADTLCKLCAREHIAVLVPSADVELAPIARLAPALAAMGTRALVSPLSALDICADKGAFADFCLGHGFPIPPLVALEQAGPPTPERPFFVRPRQGRRPDCTGLVRSSARLAALRAECPALLVQLGMAAPEYSIDTLLDWDGRPLQAVVRRRLRVRGGEACTSQVESVPALAELALGLCQALGLIGHVLVQAFWTATDGAHVIEVNPRFGGASSLAIAAGLDSPRRLLALLAGDSHARAPRTIRDGLTLLRHGEDRLIDGARLADWPQV